MPSHIVTPRGDSPQGRVADLARSGRVSGAGAVGEGGGDAAQPQAQTQSKGKIWTVDGWTAGDQKKVVSRHHSKSNNLNSGTSSSDSDSYSGGSSDSSTEDTTTSGGSIGCGRGWVRSEDSSLCCGCMCSKTPEGVPNKTNVDGSVLSGRRQLGLSRQAKCSRALILKEDNARFLLLALVLLLYMVFGALVFEAFEEGNEINERDNYLSKYSISLEELKKDIARNNVSLSQVEDLLYIWGNMTDDGHKMHGRRRWDFAGSFHFVYTVVSTIGYGAASPRTQKGKIFCIFYGLIGCSSGILFFNLFLERIITLLAFIMRRRHEMKQKRRAAAAMGADSVVENGERRGSQDSMEDSSLDAWKPSVYWVMFYLSIASIIVAFLGAIMFMEVEEWTYGDAIYFCFISFATIGFGDFVSAQKPNAFYGPGLHAYRFFNFTVLVLGCCCIYSLFNVISITIKQFLNCIIKRTATCCAGGQCRSAPRRNAISPSRQNKHSIKRMDGDIDSMYGSETERKLSGEMVSMREYISTNKSALVLPRIQEQVSLAVMQKQLYETAQLGRGHTSAPYQRPANDERFTPGQVGPLAIASSKLCEGRS
ncbi:potassium channel subfamily K member 13-like isoform X1 [Scylla paramamosain]|uniref:potassium channel subfamily K member 13-like isoform X1 n=1 Tax=Scylla paramamosain TaxID=85552 RepID=UPI003083E84F